MSQLAVWISALASIGALVLVVLIAVKLPKPQAATDVREELRTAREDAARSARELREEVAASIRAGNDSLTQGVSSITEALRTHIGEVTRALSDVSNSTRDSLDASREALDRRVHDLQTTTSVKLDEIRTATSNGIQGAGDRVNKGLEQLTASQQAQLDGVAMQLRQLVQSNQESLGVIKDVLHERVQDLQVTNHSKLAEIRQELSQSLKIQSETIDHVLRDLGSQQQQRLDLVSKSLLQISESNQGAIDRVRETLNLRVAELQSSNEQKLEQMRKTVDEKLHDTLEKRLGDSFKLVSDRLDVVHRGLGEMQQLATGVGDLKRVLTNVKARGTWAEVQLGAILEQILTPEQFCKNVQVKPDSAERVEFAVKLPGGADGDDSRVWLPIDSKFPQEDYVRLQDACERGDSVSIQSAVEAMIRAVRLAAKDISEKYVAPPHTTDFALMFLGTEGLYAEVIRQPGVIEELQQRYRIVIAGPTTLAAILSSIRMGFQTIAIQRRADDVWRVLGGVKTEFGKFGVVLERVRKQLDTASRSIEATGVRTRAMERRLKSVEALPDLETQVVLALPPGESVPLYEDEAPEDEVPV